MTTTQSLTEREKQALEHMRKAQELGTILKEYASRFGLDVQKLYQLRKPLVRKGALEIRVLHPDPTGFGPGQAASGPSFEIDSGSATDASEEAIRR